MYVILYHRLLLMMQVKEKKIYMHVDIIVRTIITNNVESF